jgi:hypothetical protein
MQIPKKGAVVAALAIAALFTGLDAAAVAPKEVLTGVLEGGTGTAPGLISGVRYVDGDLSGYTDANGQFLYHPGDAVSFYVGGVELGVTPGTAVVSPFALAGNCDTNDTLTKIVAFLYSLDSDGDPSNSLQIAPYADPGSATPIADLDDAQLNAQVQALAGPDKGLVDPQVAMDAFITLVDGETWQQTGFNTFYLLNALQRSQGAATDGRHWFFSWQFGLERTNDWYFAQQRKDPAIPPRLRWQGSNHIGDVDWFEDRIYAPIEDGSTYLHPYIGLYYAGTLNFTGKAYELPQALQTKGVPWVAVDGPRRVAYTAEWDPTPQINVFDIDHDMAYLRSIPLSKVIGRIQGAKVFEGMLYASSDDDAKDVYKINLETGTVMRLFSLAPINGAPLGEAEGLVFRDLEDGTQMHTLDVQANSLGVHFRHHRRVVPPLRDALCPVQSK